MYNTQVIDKVRKLFALSDKARNVSQAEAEAALLKAHELMAKYDITMDVTAEEEIVCVHEQCESKWNMGFRKPLASVIARNFKCELYLNGKGGSIVFFGHATDARIAREVFEYAYTFGCRGASAAYNRNYQMGLNTKGVFNSYTLGFISGLKTKLEQQSTALMVVTPPDVKSSFKEMSEDFRSSSGGMRHGQLDRNAYNDGVRDGKTLMNGRRIEGN